MEFVAVIESLTRLQNSRNGNPRYRIHFQGGTTALTLTDTQLAYTIGHSENLGVPVLVKTTPAGRVYDVRPISEES
jgi:hypothetical protein